MVASAAQYAPERWSSASQWPSAASTAYAGAVEKKSAIMPKRKKVVTPGTTRVMRPSSGSIPSRKTAMPRCASHAAIACTAAPAPPLSGASATTVSIIAAKSRMQMSAVAPATLQRSDF